MTDRSLLAQTTDAMSEAVENAAVILYGVSLAYKESANCRLEANCASAQTACSWADNALLTASMQMECSRRSI